jgi:hypothetical protein
VWESLVVNLGQRSSSLFGEEFLSVPIHSPLSGRQIGPSGGKETVPDYSSDSNPASGYYADFSYDYDFGSDPVETESEVTMTEEPLSGPATGLVITSTPARRFVYWPDRKLADLTEGNSCYVAYLDSLPFQEGTPLAPTKEHTSTEVATTNSGLGTPCWCGIWSRH